MHTKKSARVRGHTRGNKTVYTRQCASTMRKPGRGRLWIAMSCVLVATLPVGAGLRGDKEILEKLARLHRSNTQGILTWKGRALRQHTSHRDRQGFDYESTEQLEFAMNQPEGLVRWKRQTESSRILQNGREAPDSTAGLSAGLLKKGDFYEYQITDSEKDKPYHNLIVRSRRDAGGASADIYFDPSYYLLSDGSSAIYDRLMFLYEHAGEAKLFDWTVERQGDQVVVECIFGDNKEHVNRYVFSLSQGGMLKEYLVAQPDIKRRQVYEYEEVGGCWVLKSYEYSNDSNRESVGPARYSVRITWTENQVNIPLDEDEFELSKLGVKIGDFVHDQRIDMMYRYGGTAGTDTEARLPDAFDFDTRPEAAGNVLLQQEDGAQAVGPLPDENGARDQGANRVGEPSLGQAGTWAWAYVLAGLLVLSGLLGYGLLRRHRAAAKADKS